MTHIAPTLQCTAHRDGYAIWFAGKLVDVFPAFLGAHQGMRAARKAMRLLDETLKHPSTNGETNGR